MTTSGSSEHSATLYSSSPIVGFISKPAYLLLSISSIVFVLEAVVMLLLKYLPPMTSYQEAFLDASLLTFIIFPALYFLVFRPICVHIDLRRQAEDEKDSLIIELQKALDEVKTLRGFIPICASCKKIRNDKGSWQQIEAYISAHSDAEFSHGICPECAKKLYPDFVQD